MLTMKNQKEKLKNQSHSPLQQKELNVYEYGLGTTDWFQIGKGVRQGYIWSLCLFNLYAEYITRNAGLEEAQTGINIVVRNISNLRYADDTNLKAESEELKSLLMKVKEESENGLNSTFKKPRPCHLIPSHHGK